MGVEELGYVKVTGRFCPIPFQSGPFGLDSFGPISGVGRFVPILSECFGLLYFP